MQMYAQDTAAQMDLDVKQVSELFQSVIDSNGLWGENPAEKYLDKVSVRDMIQEKARLYEDMKYLFMYRDGDYILNSSTSDANEKFALMDYIWGHAEEVSTVASKNAWYISRVGDTDYAFLVYHYEAAEIYVGVAVKCEDLFYNFYQAALDQNIFLKFTDSKDGWCVTSGYNDGQISRDREIQSLSLGGGLKAAGYFEPVYLEIWGQNVLGIFILLVVVCLGSIFFQNRILNRMVLRPVKELANEAENAKGNFKHIKIKEDGQIKEVYVLQSTLKYLLEQIVATQMELYEKKVSEQDLELRQLRAQLRPHFYLNAITTISNMTYQDSQEDIREYLNHLSEYMRYMMKIKTHMVALKDELEHIENYVKMQNIRFSDSCILMTQCDKGLEDAKIPHPMLLNFSEIHKKVVKTIDSLKDRGKII